MKIDDKDERMKLECPACHEKTLLLEENGVRCENCDYEEQYPERKLIW